MKHLDALPEVLSRRQPSVLTASQLVLLRPFCVPHNVSSSSKSRSNSTVLTLNQMPRATDQSSETRPHVWFGEK